MIDVRPAIPADAPAITAIYNVGIAERAATFETVPRQVEDLLERLHQTDRHPLLVATEDGGNVVGWAGLGSYRSRDC